MPSSGYRLNEYHFSGEASWDPDGELISYFWDMGDGTVRMGESVDHTYISIGVKKVCLKVTDNLGLTVRECERITILNNPPEISRAPDRVAYIDTLLTFDARGAFDREDDIDDLHFEWDMGDGTIRSGVRVHHSFHTARDHIVRLKIWDPDGSQTSSMQLVSVRPWNSPVWARMVVSSGGYTPVNLAVGASPLAKDGYDPDLDIPLPPAPPNRPKFEAYLDLDDPDFPRLFSNTVGFGEVVSWDLTMRSDEPISVDITSDIPAGYNHLELYLDGKRYDVTSGGILGFNPGLHSGTLSAKVVLQALSNHPPDGAEFYVGQTYEADSGPSFIPEGTPVDHLWTVSMGDEVLHSTTEETLAYSLERVGNTTVCLSLSGGDDDDTTCWSFDCLNRPPEMELSGKDTVALGDMVEVGVVASDPEGTISSVDWQILRVDASQHSSGTGTTIRQMMDEPGEMTLVVTVVDDLGSSTSRSMRVTVENSPPTIEIMVPGEMMSLTPVRLGFSLDDPDSDVSDDTIQVTIDGRLVTSEELVEGVVFTTSGEHLIQASVVDEWGGVGSTTTTVLVGNRPPRASLRESYRIRSDMDLQIPLMYSLDPDGMIIHYMVDWGDGTTPTTVAQPTTLYHRYERKGDHTVALSVIDNYGARDMAESVVTILNTRPRAVVADRLEVPSLSPVVLDASGSIDDGRIVSFAWDVDDSDGIDQLIDGSSVVTSYETPGLYTATVRLVDEDGQVAYGWTRVTVTNRAPSVSIIGPIDIMSLTTHEYRVEIDDDDGDIHQVLWTVDGEVSTSPIISKAFILSGVTYIHVTVRDEYGGEDSETISVIVQNRPPEASMFPARGGFTGEKINFRVHAMDPDGDYSVNWYSEGIKEMKANPSSRTRSSVMDSYDRMSGYWEVPGIYRVTAFVSDSFGSGVSVSTEVEVLNRHPHLDYDDRSLFSGERFDLVPLYAWDEDGQVVSHTWYIGEDVYHEDLRDHIIDEPGLYNCTLVVTDDRRDSTERYFKLFVTSMEMKMVIREGWNLVSLPLKVEDTHVNSVFGKDAKAYSWDAEGRRYHRVFDLEYGRAYFVSSRETRVIDLTGSLIYDNALDLHRGWNDVGSASTTILMEDIHVVSHDANTPTIDPDLIYMYGYDAVLQDYFMVEAIQPGMGVMMASYVDAGLTVDTDRGVVKGTP